MQWHMAMAMAIAMVMLSSERMPPWMPKSQDEAHTMIADVTEITVSSSENDLLLVRVTSAKLMVGWRTLRQWSYGGQCHFRCYSFLFSLLLYFFGSRLSKNGIGICFYHLRR
jgi:hypothetical protein